MHQQCTSSAPIALSLGFANMNYNNNDNNNDNKIELHATRHLITFGNTNVELLRQTVSQPSISSFDSLNDILVYTYVKYTSGIAYWYIDVMKK